MPDIRHQEAPGRGCVAGQYPRCSVYVVIMHFPERGTPCFCLSCLLVLLSGL